MPREMTDSRTGAGNIQDEPRSPHSARKEESTNYTQNNEGISERYRS